MIVFERVWQTEEHSGVAAAGVSEVWGVPEHRTPRGRAPMVVRHIRVTYWNVRNPERVSVELIGLRAEQVGTERPSYRGGSWPESFLRRIPPERVPDQPQWILDFVEDHRPAACAS